MEKIKEGSKNIRGKRHIPLKWRDTLQLSILTIPVIIWFIIFSYIPMFGCIIAFKDFDYRAGIWGSKWCGFRNFKYLFSSNDAIRILRNTIFYNVTFILLGIIIGVAMALLLEQIKNRVMIKTFQTMIFLPHFVSWVVVAFVAQGLFKYESGIFNSILMKFGMAPKQWYTDVKPWPAILIIANIWKTIGFNTLIYYGGLLGIDTTLYEAAAIDGATTMQRIFKITIPMLLPTITILFIMGVGNVFRADFGLFYYIPNNYGSLYGVTDVIDTYIFRALKVSGELSGSSAASFFQSVCGLILVLAANGTVRKINPENAMF